MTRDTPALSIVPRGWPDAWAMAAAVLRDELERRTGAKAKSAEREVTPQPLGTRPTLGGGAA